MLGRCHMPCSISSQAVMSDILTSFVTCAATLPGNVWAHDCGWVAASPVRSASKINKYINKKTHSCVLHASKLKRYKQNNNSSRNKCGRVCSGVGRAVGESSGRAWRSCDVRWIGHAMDSGRHGRPEEVRGARRTGVIVLAGGLGSGCCLLSSYLHLWATRHKPLHSPQPPPPPP